MKKIKKRTPRKEELMDIMINKGVLYEANRTFFNPLGLELTLGENGYLGIEMTDEPQGMLLDRVDQFLINAFRDFIKSKHQQRQEHCGFIIQTKDMYRSENIDSKKPLAQKESVKLRLLLTNLDKIVFECKKKLMGESAKKDASPKGFSRMHKHKLIGKLESNMLTGDYVDVINFAAMLASIDDLNKEIKRIKDTHLDPIYKG
jgi:hypothetical protein